MSNTKTQVLSFVICALSLFLILCFVICHYSYAQDIKEPNVAGSFYPADPKELSLQIDSLLERANPEAVKEEIFALISPHAGYEFSGETASFGYKLIKGKPYKTVIIIGVSHRYAFSGISVYPEGLFRTPLGDLEVDKKLAQKLLNKDSGVYFKPQAFAREHSVEAQLPFLQRALSDFKIVPIVMGGCSFSDCQKLASLLKGVIGKRKDVLVIASSDMYHGYNYEESDMVDNLTLDYLKRMDAEGLYSGLASGKLQLCGGLPVVTTLILANGLGHNKLKVLRHTNSAEATGRMVKDIWTVGYTSCAVGQEKGESPMLNKTQRKKLLKIARESIETYLKTGKKLEVNEAEPVLLKEMGAFVTLHKDGQLRGCIGNLIGKQALYLTARDMAVEAAVDDPRFPPLTQKELKDVEIEISALSPLERVYDAEKIQLGVHGVLLRSGFNSGVFLPQVAAETGWSKEEFLSNLCSHKAGLSPVAWKDKSTEIYIFTAEVFSEKDT